MSATGHDALDLVADIGGTNARFALTDPRIEAPRLLEPRVLATGEFASLADAATRYLAVVGVMPARAAFAVASPVADDAIKLTNRAWSFSRSALQRELGLQRLVVLNDFGAIARAIPLLGAGDLEPIQGDPAEPLVGPVSVIGPGTGFGVALLIGDAVRGWEAIETEGGHAAFAPLDEEEHAIADWLDARYGRTSNERLLSGSGLAHIEAVIAGLASGRMPEPRDALLSEPATIVAAALAGHDAVARRALARFCAVLGSVAGDTALLHGARTVMIAGGIVPRFVPFLRESGFRERFLAKGRFAPLLERVAVHVVTHPMPGLLGAAAALRA